MEYGYVRVSTKDQHADRQLAAMRAFGIAQENIFADKESGGTFQRRQYQVLLRKLHEGDVLVVKELDRLGRNYAEILENWRKITAVKGADIVVLDMPLLDTRDRAGDLTHRFIADLVLQVLSYVAETERRNIRQRQAEGIAAAKARGVKFGNPAKPLPEGFAKAVSQWKAGKISARHAAEVLGVSVSYFYKHVK